jgi:hypothetical protein
LKDVSSFHVADINQDFSDFAWLARLDKRNPLLLIRLAFKSELEKSQNLTTGATYSKGYQQLSGG